MNNFTISRSFNAPRSLVFKCWVEPKHFEKWGLAPHGCTCRLIHADVRPGGFYHVEEQSPDGNICHIKFSFQQITPIDLLVFVVSFCNEAGEPTKHPALPNWPDRLLTTVTFADENEGTKVSVLWEPVEATDEQLKFFFQNLHMGQQGWTETFERLQTALDDLTIEF